jgi:hypothetical protein
VAPLTTVTAPLSSAHGRHYLVSLASWIFPAFRGAKGPSAGGANILREGARELLGRSMIDMAGIGRICGMTV